MRIFSSYVQYLVLSIPQKCITFSSLVLSSISTLGWASSHPMTDAGDPLEILTRLFTIMPLLFLPH